MRICSGGRWCWLLLLAPAGVGGQRPPPFSEPKVVPQDLQINGEWWFYTLLDSQFPHDVLTPLPLSAVAPADSPEGSPLFVSLPEAEYLLLEFFAPWCPHCQHFAPEMVKVVSVLRSAPAVGGRPLVVARTVDCEKLEMTAACDWANANMMPRLVLALRESLLGPLGPTVSDTPGMQELFPVRSAQQALDWMQQHVLAWPQGLPAPTPLDTEAPFFGWAQPPEGATEPLQAPAQDLEVAVVSLLHEAFSSLDFQPTKQQALLDLLGLLCSVGPGGSTCRQSACDMQADLQQNWGTLTTQATVTRNAQGEPMPATTFHYLKWSEVEHRHRWCNRPWPDFAQEGWSWCRGRTPGTRGYTCGLWMLFHGLMAGAASAEEAGLPAPSKAPLEVVRGTISSFFGCADCREHFLSVPVTPADLASPAAQALWLWRAHNLATERIAREEHEHNAAAPPRLQWPSALACPQCRTPDGAGWNEEAVYQHLRRFYAAANSGSGNAAGAGFLGASPAGVMSKYQQLPAATAVPPAAPAQAPVQAAPVSLEVYYYTLCPHCLYFLKLGLAPLVEAQLPGSQVQITLLPVYPPLLQYLDNRELCLQHEDCHLAMAPLCGLKAAAQPGPADSTALLAGTRFAACDITHTAVGQGRDPAATKACAEAASLPWEELQACAEGPESQALLQKGSRNIMAAMNLLHGKTGYQDPPSMPWVLLDGDLMLCEDGKACTAVQTPSGDVPLPAPASLLSLVCKKLNPQPVGCASEGALMQQALDQAYKEAGGAAAEKAAVKKAKACQNCEEVGSFHWHPAQEAHRLPTVPMAVMGAAACASLLGYIVWKRARRGPLGLEGAQVALSPETVAE